MTFWNLLMWKVILKEHILTILIIYDDVPYFYLKMLSHILFMGARCTVTYNKVREACHVCKASPVKGIYFRVKCCNACMLFFRFDQLQSAYTLIICSDEVYWLIKLMFAVMEMMEMVYVNWQPLLELKDVKIVVIKHV